MKKAIIFDFKRTIYDPDLGQLMPGTRSVLTSLKKKGYRLFLISHGSYPQTLIKNLGIASYFEEIVVTPDKSVEDFRKLVAKHRLDPKSSFVVGDRVKGEIKMGNQLGLISIWLKKGLFASEEPSERQEKPDFIISTLKDILKLVT
jgi:FMN phosphatase YigB (HAD superfamily)